jgi:GTP-binding protein YchF
MNLSLGIVGLPNVGKSTLFNALTNQNIPAENYPFCTIDPNVGIVPVVDPRLQQLADLVKPAKVTPAVVEFWDIAGLVKGAAEGAGLGNKFLANIRNVNAIVHVVRAFQNSNIIHVETSIAPERDVELVNMELILKDLETVRDKLGSLQGKARTNAEFKPQAEALEALKKHLEEGKLALTFPLESLSKDVVELVHSLFLLTSKPVIYLVNSEDSQIKANVAKVKAMVHQTAAVIGMDIKLEADLIALPEEEKKEYMTELGMKETALDRLTREAYKLLGLISFFTAGEKEVRAWTIKQGMKSPEAAGVIHTDFQSHFITSDVVKFTDFIACGGWAGAKAAGKIKLGGKDYVVEDGDVMLFRHNA